MIKQHNAYIVGYYGMNNSGDDALMCASDIGAQLLAENSANAISCATEVSAPLRSEQCLPPSLNVKGIQRFSHYKNALQSANVIFGGGSVLHSKRDIEFKHHLVKLSGGKLSRAVGVGIEPFTDSATERACAKLLNILPFVGVRDKQSYEIAKAISPNANVHLTFDLAPTLLSDKVRFIRQSRRSGIGFNFCPRAIDAFNNVDPKSEGRRIARARATIVECARKTDQPIYLIDFNANSINGDTHVHQKIMASLPNDIHVTHLPYTPDPFELMNKLSGLKAMVGMRLHAAILAFLVETPCISINYHKKCYSWCEQAGIPTLHQFCSEDISPADIAEVVQSGIGTGFAKPTLSVDEARAAALRNWRKLS